MADEIQLSQENPNAVKHNAEVATQMAAQDIGGKSMAPEAQEETTDALDSLRSEARKKAEELIAPTSDKETPISEKPADDAVATTTDAAEPVTESDIFAGIELPPKASPKSGEAFAAVKLKAGQEISAREETIASLKKSLSEAEEKLKKPIPDELTQELEEHRTFRSRLDVEADPKFKEYDKQIAGVQDFIYAQLLKTGKLTQEHVDAIKKYGGPENVNLEKIFTVVDDPIVKRIVESKVADIEMLKHQKDTDIKQTRENVQQYLKEREDSFSKATTAHNDATKQQLTLLTGKLPWLSEKELPKDADDAAKASVKAHNEFVKSTKADLDTALSDDSPQMRAILLAGMAQLLNTKRTLADATKEKEALTGQIAELTKKVERLSSASVSRLREATAPAVSRNADANKETNYDQSAAEGLDAARKKVLDERRAKENA